MKRTADGLNPITMNAANTSCDKAWFGWPCDAEFEKLREAYVRAQAAEERKPIAEQAGRRYADRGARGRRGSAQDRARRAPGPTAGDLEPPEVTGPKGAAGA
jgi:hypothetical protein